MPYLENPVSVLLRITPRREYWRVAVVLQDKILWRCYRKAEYPTPEAVTERCLQGLANHRPARSRETRTTGSKTGALPPADKGSELSSVTPPMQQVEGEARQQKDHHRSQQPAKGRQTPEGTETLNHGSAPVRVRVLSWGWL